MRFSRRFVVTISGASGADGVVRGVAVLAEEAGPTPNAFSANTMHEYSTPLVRPITIHGLLVNVLTTVDCPGAAHEVV